MSRYLCYYNINHRIQRQAIRLILNGKKTINICDSRINYAKNRDIYLFLQAYSKECYNLIK